MNDLLHNITQGVVAVSQASAEILIALFGALLYTLHAKRKQTLNHLAIALLSAVVVGFLSFLWGDVYSLTQAVTVSVAALCGFCVYMVLYVASGFGLYFMHDEPFQKALYDNFRQSILKRISKP